MLNTQKLVIIGGVAVILVFFGYSFFMNKEGVHDRVQSGAESGEDILVLVDTLNKISIDETLFTSELFTGLRDFSVSLYPEQQGRPNPFASIGIDLANSIQPQIPKKTE